MFTHYINQSIRLKQCQLSAVEANVQSRNKRRNATQQMSAFGGKRANAAKNESQVTKRRHQLHLHLHLQYRFTSTFLQLPSKHHPGRL